MNTSITAEQMLGYLQSMMNDWQEKRSGTVRMTESSARRCRP